MIIFTNILDKFGFVRNSISYSSKDIGLFPNFLGIGAQKSGTSWLFKNLRKLLLNGQGDQIDLCKDCDIPYRQSPIFWWTL